MNHPHHDFENREALAKALAARVAASLSRCITLNGAAALAVSGGTTPQLFFEQLSLQHITWNKVSVTLVDERQVLENHARSNAALVKNNLLRNHAKAAKFVPLYQNPKAGNLNLDVVVLGMGNDGHTASFFPQGDNLTEALSPNCTTPIIAMQAPAAGEPRLTFSLNKILAAQSLFLHIEGQEKRDVLAKANAGTDVMAMPIRAVLQSAKPLQIYWCP